MQTDTYLQIKKIYCIPWNRIKFFQKLDLKKDSVVKKFKNF